jgi:hypothetical protein
MRGEMPAIFHPPSAHSLSIGLIAEAGPLYLAKLFRSNDTEAMMRLITALPVLVLDPLAVLLTLAASPDNWAVLA